MAQLVAHRSYVPAVQGSSPWWSICIYRYIFLYTHIWLTRLRRKVASLAANKQKDLFIQQYNSIYFCEIVKLYINRSFFVYKYICIYDYYIVIYKYARHLNTYFNWIYSSRWISKSTYVIWLHNCMCCTYIIKWKIQFQMQ